MAHCEMVSLVDSQHVTMNVHPMTAQSKLITPKMPGHFSLAYGKVSGLSAGMKAFEISITNRDEYTKALGSSKGWRNLTA